MPEWYPLFHPQAPPWEPPPCPAENLIQAELARERVVMKRALYRRGIFLPQDTTTEVLVAVSKALGTLPQGTAP